MYTRRQTWTKFCLVSLILCASHTCVSEFWSVFYLNRFAVVFKYGVGTVIPVFLGSFIMNYGAFALQLKTLLEVQFRDSTLCYLVFLFFLFEPILYAILTGCAMFMIKLDSVLRNFNIVMCWLSPLQLLVHVYIQENGHDLLRFCPAIIDILDSIEMFTSKSASTNPVWVQVTICLAVLVFYISSVLEIHLLRYPESPNRSILSGRRIGLAQLVFTVVFLSLRVVLFAHNPQEFILVVKTLIRVYSHYKHLSSPWHYSTKRTSESSESSFLSEATFFIPQLEESSDNETDVQ